MKNKILIGILVGILLTSSISVFAFSQKQFSYIETLSSGGFNNAKLYRHNPTGTFYIINIDGGITPVYNQDGKTLYVEGK